MKASAAKAAPATPKKVTEVKSTEIPVGSHVEFDPKGDGNTITGKVLESGKNKIKVQPDDENEEPITVSSKIVTVTKKGNGKTPRAKVAPEDSKSITKGADLSKYVRNTETKTPGGRPSFDINDQAASLLRGKSFEDSCKIVAKASAANGNKDVTAAFLAEKYGKLNPGQQRMNLGNRLRAALREKDAAEAE